MKKINKIVDRKSKIQNPLESVKITDEKFRGIINFNNVSFSYPK
jgi:ABC-type multidrug transport system fused ATPase/permease subunit